jgi:Flp pilus assembly pilin Flp
MCACVQLRTDSWQVLGLGNHPTSGEGANMTHLLRKLWSHEEGQDIAEYAVMLAVILILVIGTIRLVGGNANNAFSTVASSLQ